jgi:hypothetical protein
MRETIRCRVLDVIRERGDIGAGRAVGWVRSGTDFGKIFASFFARFFISHRPISSFG